MIHLLPGLGRAHARVASVEPLPVQIRPSLGSAKGKLAVDFRTVRLGYLRSCCCPGLSSYPVRPCFSTLSRRHFVGFAIGRHTYNPARPRQRVASAVSAGHSRSLSSGGRTSRHITSAHRHAAGQVVTLAGGKAELGQYALLPPVSATDLCPGGSGGLPANPGSRRRDLHFPGVRWRADLRNGNWKLETGTRWLYNEFWIFANFDLPVSSFQFPNPKIQNLNFRMYHWLPDGMATLSCFSTMITIPSTARMRSVANNRRVSELTSASTNRQGATGSLRRARYQGNTTIHNSSEPSPHRRGLGTSLS